MNDDPKKLRTSAEAFAIKAYEQMKHHRLYALPPQAKVVLGVLARAMFIRREAEGRKDGDGKSPSAHKEFFGIVEALSRAGANILQARPTDPRPLPKPWLNPISGQPLPPPKSPDERALLAKRDPDLLAWYDKLEKSPYKTLADHMEAEAAREAMAKLEYSELINEANPFRRGDQTEMANLFKRDPTLAQFCQQEAKDVELNLFGSNRDLTVRGKLTKDREASAIVELAEKIDQQWRMEDKAALTEAKTAAERKLAELSAGETPEPPRMIARIRTGVE